MYQILSIHLAIGNNAAINIGVQVFESLLSGLPDIYQLGELLDDMIIIVRHFEEPLNCFPQQQHHFTFQSPMQKGFNFTTSLAILFFPSKFLKTTILRCIKWYLILVFKCISVMISDGKHLFMCLLANYISSLEKCLWKAFDNL